MSSLIFLIIIILLGFIALFYFLNKKFQELKKEEQILPKQAFKLQHQFRQGQIVDAIIKTS